LTLLFSAIFLWPLYAVLPSFWHWIRDLFIHTGQYGSGGTGVINMPVFAANLGRIFLANGWFTVSFAVVAGTVFFTAFPRFRENGRRVRLLRGILAVFIMNILMVAKHFSAHYMIISHSFAIIGLMISLGVIHDIFHPHRQLRKSSELLLVVVGSACLIAWMISAVGYSPRLRNPRVESLAWAKSPLPRIIVLESPGPFRETALYHGMSFSGEMKGRYAVLLRRLYPNTFFYYPGEDKIVDWSHDVNMNSLISRFPEINLFYTSRKDTIPASLAATLETLRAQGWITSVKILQRNTITSEYLYRIESDTAKARDLITEYREEVPSELPLRLNHATPYGANMKFRLKKGYYELNVMRKSTDNKGALVVADTKGMGLYSSVESPVATVKGWDHLTLLLNVTQEMEGREVQLYLWYPGKKECIFKDLRITRFEIR
jgi:hypothetical protein